MSRTSLGRLDLSGRGTIVTGAAQGMGEATARLLAERGAHVLVADRNAEGAAHVAEGVGELAVPFAVDVTDPDDCFAMVEAALEHFGRLDAAVNNAGITPEGTYIADTTDEDWRRLISTNLESVFYCMRAELPPMLEAGQGSIVNIGSIMSGAGLEASAAYTAAKHGVLGLTRCCTRVQPLRHPCHMCRTGLHGHTHESAWSGHSRGSGPDAFLPVHSSPRPRLGGSRDGRLLGF